MEKGTMRDGERVTRLDEDGCDCGTGDSMGYGLWKRLLETRTILVSQPIDDGLAQKIYAALFILERDDVKAPITVIVNSPGGSADSGFGIYDMLRFVKPPIRSIAAGLVASAAVPIFLAAEKGQRFTLPNARFLLHQPSTMAVGAASDIEITAREIERIKQRYNQIVSAATGQDEAKIAGDSDRDFWLEAEEAKAYGLVDRIVERRGEID